MEITKSNGRTLSINCGIGTHYIWGSHHFVMGCWQSRAGNLKRWKYDWDFALFKGRWVR